MGCGGSKSNVIVQPEAPKTSEAAVERAEGIAAAFEKAEDVLNAAQAAATVAARKAAKGDLKGAKEALIDHAVEQRDQALGTFVPTFDEEKKIVKIESVARGQQARSELAAMARLADEEQAKRYDVKKLKREGWAAASPVAIFPGFMSSSLEVKRCDRDKSWVGDRIWCDINKLGAARFIKKDGRLARKQVAEEVADEIEEMLDSPRACVEELLRDGRAVLQQAAGQSTSRLERLERLIKARDFGPYADENGELVVCFIHGTDITGGNSGSPVMNADGDLIGLAFDGNWEAMSGDIAFEPQLQRTISVDIRYVMWLLDKYAGCTNLIEEMDFVYATDEPADLLEEPQLSEPEGGK